MAQLDFDPVKLKKVKISAVIPNTWNPKKKDTEEYQKVRDSIWQKGLRGAIVVRKHPTKRSKYEIIDGMQRYTAAVELGYEELYIYDEGAVSDQEARELTVWYQQQVPFDMMDEATLAVNMIDAYGIDSVELPYTEKDIEQFRALLDYVPVAETVADETQLSDVRTLKIKLSKGSYDVIMKAVRHMMSDVNSNEARALELICADYLSGVGEFVESDEDDSDIYGQVGEVGEV